MHKTETSLYITFWLWVLSLLSTINMNTNIILYCSYASLCSLFLITELTSSWSQRLFCLLLITCVYALPYHYVMVKCQPTCIKEDAGLSSGSLVLESMGWVQDHRPTIAAFQLEGFCNVIDLNEFESVPLKSIFWHSWQQIWDNEVGLCCVFHGGTVWVPHPVSQP